MSSMPLVYTHTSINYKSQIDAINKKLDNLSDHINILSKSLTRIQKQINNKYLTINKKTIKSDSNYIDNTTFTSEKQKMIDDFNNQIDDLKNIIDNLKNQINSQKNDTPPSQPDQPSNQQHQQQPIFENEYNSLKMMASVLQPPTIAIDIFNLDEQKIVAFIKQNYEFNLQKAMIAEKYNLLTQYFPSKDLSQFKDIKPISPLKETMYAIIDTVNRQLQYTNKNAVMACEIYQTIDHFLEQHPDCSFESCKQQANIYANGLSSAMLHRQIDYFKELFNEIWNTPVLELPNNDNEAKQQYDEYNDFCYFNPLTEDDEINTNLKAFDDKYNTKQNLSDILSIADATIETCYDAGIYTNQYAQQSSSRYDQDDAEDIKTDISYNLNYLYPGTTLY